MAPTMTTGFAQLTVRSTVVSEAIDRLTEKGSLVESVCTMCHDNARGDRIPGAQQAIGDLCESELNGRILVSASLGGTYNQTRIDVDDLSTIDVGNVEHVWHR